MRKGEEHAAKEPFGDLPKGPLQIFISINQQRLHFYSDGVHVADVPVATGVPGHLTPLGVFDVIQRDRYHHSNIYSNAPMPYMQRITWSGVALHEGPGVGHEASHGCIRMPHNFAARLWLLPTMGMRVVITRPELRPEDIADPHLFVHKDQPSVPVASLTPAVETAQTTKPGTKTDAADLPQRGPASQSTTQPNEAAPSATALAAAGSSPAQPATAAATPTQSSDPAAMGQPPKATDAQPATSGNSASADAAPNANAAPIPAAAATSATADAIATPISLDDVPMPPAKPSSIAKSGAGPIAIFISRKLGKIFVRQDFTPLFDAPVKIENPTEPLGTHVFTALNYLPDHSTFQWNVVSLPAEAPKTVAHWKYVTTRYGEHKRIRVRERLGDAENAMPPETPQEALARIQIPQDVIDQISQLIVPGSSLIISDQGFGPETGRGTDFIIVQR